MGGGDSGGGQSTQTVVQQIPDWQQGYAQQNESIAASIAAQPYQTYQGQTIAGFSPQQQSGLDMTNQASTAYQPYLNAATQSANQASTAMQPYQQAAAGLTAAGSQTWGQASPQQQAAYMNPYVMQSLAPQLQQLQIQQGQQQQALNASSTQAGAYGDARQGVAQSLNDFYGNLAQNDLVSQGMNTAYNNAQTAYNTGAQQQLTAGNQMSQLGTAAQTGDLNTANAYSTLGNQAQTNGLTGASAQFSAGTQQQQLTQEQLTEAYNNFMNQVNYPQQQLNSRISALANSPLTTSNQTSLAPANSSAMNLGAFGALAGGLGSLFGGSSGTSGSAASAAGSIFGGGSGGTTSDIRAKKNLERRGETGFGIPVYAFNYVWEDDEAPKQIGVMAQDVEKFIPEAVSHTPSGVKLVDYSMVR